MRQRKIKVDTIRSKEWIVAHYRSIGLIKVNETVKSVRLLTKKYEITLEEKE